MLWFNKLHFRIVIHFFRFQYILCCGSTQKKQNLFYFCWNFNTSYVVVQHLSAYLSNVELTFQYILCCGSTFWSLELVLDYRNFNTSYVVVQRPIVFPANKLEFTFQYILCCGSTF